MRGTLNDDGYRCSLAVLTAHGVNERVAGWVQQCIPEKFLFCFGSIPTGGEADGWQITPKVTFVLRSNRHHNSHASVVGGGTEGVWPVEQDEHKQAQRLSKAVIHLTV